MHETYTKWLEDGKPKIFCACSCGGEIIINVYHKWQGIPKYINHHYSKGKPRSENSKQKNRENNPWLGKTGNNSFRFGKQHTQESNQKNREKHLGKVCSEETREKIRVKRIGTHPSEITKQKLRDNQPDQSGKKSSRFGIPPSHRAGYGKGCHYNSPLQGKIYLRSSYELAYVKYLDSKNILWMYEMETFDLGDTTYTPDFFLPATEQFIEIKGYMTDKAQDKINKFLEQYPWDLEILRKNDLIKLGVLK